MKKRATLLLACVLFLGGTGFNPIFGQDTILPGSTLNPESWNSMKEVMEQAMKEQLRSMNLNTDSLRQYLEKVREQIRSMPVPEIPIIEYPRNTGMPFNSDVKTITVTMDGKSKPRVNVINVDRELEVLYILITGMVKSGSLQVEIYDPKGTKQGVFSMENENGENGEIVNGSMNKSMKSPAIGEWTVKVRSVNAFGHIRITSIKSVRKEAE